MNMSDYNHQEFILEFENHLRAEGFHLKKSFDDSNKGGRFFKDGYKNKAFGRYKFIDGSMTTSGCPMIIWTLFSMQDKTGKEICASSTNYFWYKPKNGSTYKPKKQFNEAEHKRLMAERVEKELKLQLSLSVIAKGEYDELKVASENPNNHPYIVRKKVKAGRGLILANSNMKIPSYYNQFKSSERDMTFYHIRKGDLLIPSTNLDLRFVTYQRITGDGVKLQRVDISTIGAFYCLGDWRTSTKRIFLCEGYATGYSLYEATKGVVFVCFDVANVGVLAKSLKERFPDIEVVICTDNDRKKTTKVGLYKGFEYSYLYNSPFIFPVFPNEEKYDNDSDWNDMAQHFSLERIQECCEKQIQFFHSVGKNKCIELVAKKNGLSGEDLKIYRGNNKLVFQTMDLSFTNV